MKKFLLTLMGISALALTGILFPLHPENSFAETNHIVISEIQISGIGTGTSVNDFVELYNPTNSDVNLDGMRLGKKTSGTSSDNVVIFASDDIVPAHGYFLWCNTSLNTSLSCDSSGSGTLSNNNSLALINGTLASGTIIDAVSFGIPGTTFGEGVSLTAPEGNTSVERKANSTSTSMSMNIGGLDEFLGNGEDTDNNSIDFVTRSVPQPQNSASEIEPTLVSPTPTLEPTAEPTPTVTPTNEPTPTPTIEPSPTPTSEPSPTPIPTEEPSVTPTLSPIPTPTIIPTITPTPTKGPKIFSSNPIMTCHINYKSIKVFRKTFYFPLVACFRTLR